MKRLNKIGMIGLAFCALLLFAAAAVPPILVIAAAIKVLFY